MTEVETTVNVWAFQEMGLMDGNEKVAAKDVICYLCIVSTSGYCLKMFYEGIGLIGNPGNRKKRNGEANGLVI